jgi:hypothetical protein
VGSGETATKTASKRAANEATLTGGILAVSGYYANPSRTASIVTTRSDPEKIRIYITIAS